MLQTAEPDELARMFAEYSLDELALTLSAPVKWQRPTRWSLFYHYVLPSRISRDSAEPSAWRPVVRAKARAIAGAIPNDYWAVARLREWVVRTIRYGYVFGLTPDQTYDPAHILASGVGECGRRNCLLIGLCRALGIPARRSFSGTGPTQTHMWSEVWLAGRWTMADASGAGFDDPHPYGARYVAAGTLRWEGRDDARETAGALHYSLQALDWAQRGAGSEPDRSSAQWAAVQAAYDQQDFGTTDRLGKAMLHRLAAESQRRSHGRELRAAFVYTFARPASEVVASAVAAGLNTLVVMPWNLYSPVDERRAKTVDQLMEAGERSGLAVYLCGWGNWSGTLAKREPARAQLRAGGKPDANGLCPLLPENRIALANSLREWARRWPRVRGLILQMWYADALEEPARCCLCPRCTAAFAQATGRSAAAAAELVFHSMDKEQKQLYAAWYDWRAATITQCHRELRLLWRGLLPRAEYLPYVLPFSNSYIHANGSDLAALAKLSDGVVALTSFHSPLNAAGLLWGMMDDRYFATRAGAWRESFGVEAGGLPADSRLLARFAVRNTDAASVVQGAIAETRLAGAAGYLLDWNAPVPAALVRAVASLNGTDPPALNLLNLEDDDCLPGPKLPPEQRRRLAEMAELPPELTWQADGAVMVRVDAGRYRYGQDGEERELPAFYVDRHEVTNERFAGFVAETGHVTTAERLGNANLIVDGRWTNHEGLSWRHPRGPQSSLAGREREPVVYVSWDDAEAFARWCGKELPTAEQWQKAARGTDGRLYPWGNEWDEQACANAGTSPQGPAPVGSYPKDRSPWGAFDLCGNVGEWTRTLAPDHERGVFAVAGRSHLTAPAAANFMLWHVPTRGSRLGAQARVNWVGFRCCVTVP